MLSLAQTDFKVTLMGPLGGGFPDESSDLFLSFCRRHNSGIASSWFQRKDIRRFLWTSNVALHGKGLPPVIFLCISA